MDIRQIETIIDEEHKKTMCFIVPYNQMVFDLLTTFEDLCSLTMLGVALNPFAIRKIVDYMDALNMALTWSHELCEGRSQDIKLKISEVRYEQCCKLLLNYAYPYSVICSGYIGYSRKRFEAEVEDNCVTFNFSKDQNQSVIADILREQEEGTTELLPFLLEWAELWQFRSDLKKDCSIENGSLRYSIGPDILDKSLSVANKQWEATKTLPDDWKFDLFTLEEYRKTWVAITAICYIHCLAYMTIADAEIRMNNEIICQKKRDIVEYIVEITKLEESNVESIISYITYDPSKHNVDIMYQPVVSVDSDLLLIAPFLFVGSRPERNLLSVVSTRHDKAYSKEVNGLEELMVSELKRYVKSPDIVEHRHLRDDLPDIDFAILDRTTASAIICETKWFASADSTKEVYAKEDEITHGCQQIEAIMGYALSDKNHFFKQVFGISDGESIDLFGCVVAKHNIRSQHKYVPVIGQKKFEDLLTAYPLNSVFHIIRNHEYEAALPSGAKIAHQSIDYAGFTFKIPAVCFENDIDIFEEPPL